MIARSPKERKADAVSKLEAVESNVWVASASPSGDVHLVPVTHTWNGSQVVLATGPTSRTVSNITANQRARLALGESRDVVMIDALLIEAIPASKAPAQLAEGYAAQAGWDPRTDSSNYVYLVFGPERASGVSALGGPCLRCRGIRLRSDHSSIRSLLDHCTVPRLGVDS